MFQVAEILTLAAIPGRECDGCTLCCNLLAVPAIDKPQGQWCQHCAPDKGCAIYRDRPGVCRAWNCGWRIWQWLGEEWHPLRSKIVINPNVSPDPDHSAIDVLVDPAYPDQWRKPEYLSQLRLLAHRGLERAPNFRVIINVDGYRKWIIFPNKEVEFNRFQKLAKAVRHEATCRLC